MKGKTEHDAGTRAHVQVTASDSSATATTLQELEQRVRNSTERYTSAFKQDMAAYDYIMRMTVCRANDRRRRSNEEAREETGKRTKD